jgi:hypothetical protein
MRPSGVGSYAMLKTNKVVMIEATPALRANI